jgi:hypothetical protein
MRLAAAGILDGRLVHNRVRHRACLELRDVTRRIGRRETAFCVISVTVSVPAWPCSKPLSKFMGMRLRRSGNAKVVWPLPPYILPSKEKSAVFCEMARS